MGWWTVCPERNSTPVSEPRAQAAVGVAAGVPSKGLIVRPQHSGQSAAFLQLKPDPPEGSRPDAHTCSYRPGGQSAVPPDQAQF